jgi:hypothetical protein
MKLNIKKIIKIEIDIGVMIQWILIILVEKKKTTIMIENKEKDLDKEVGIILEILIQTKSFMEIILIINIKNHLKVD